MRNRTEKYPQYTAEIEFIKKNGITAQLLSKIITKHLSNSSYNKMLYDRYQTLDDSVPIFLRKSRPTDHPI